MATIKQVTARQILDSKGNPAVEATVVLMDGTRASASCPNSNSKGSYEAYELYDNDMKHFQGKGVLKAIATIQDQISPQLVGIDATDQRQVDGIMLQLDGTQAKTKLGANAILPVSTAVAKAAAKSNVVPLYLYLRNFIASDGLGLKLPTPIFDIINGGAHGGYNSDFQEFTVIPATSKPFDEAMEVGVSVYHHLGELLTKNSMPTTVGDEGGFAPPMATNEDGFSLLTRAIGASNLRLGYDIFIGLDAAANNIRVDQRYKIKDKPLALSSQEITSFYDDLVKRHHLLYLEDPLSEDDWEGWAGLALQIGQHAMVIGDDITASNPLRLQMAINQHVINGIVIKPNQIGTVIEALAVAEIARHAGLKLIISNRSGETNDDFLADFAVAVAADHVKFGAPARGERVAKYNRLMYINEQIKKITQSEQPQQG
jgi:enolase